MFLLRMARSLGPISPVCLLRVGSQKYERQDAAAVAQAEALAEASLPEDVAMATEIAGLRGAGFMVYELWNGDGAGPTAEQQQQQRQAWLDDAAKREAAAQAAAQAGAAQAAAGAATAAREAGDGGALAGSGAADGAAAGPGEAWACPWPRCDALGHSKRGRTAHLRAHRRQSRSRIRYDDAAARNVPPALLCPISNKVGSLGPRPPLTVRPSSLSPLLPRTPTTPTTPTHFTLKMRTGRFDLLAKLAPRCLPFPCAPRSLTAPKRI